MLGCVFLENRICSLISDRSSCWGEVHGAKDGDSSEEQLGGWWKMTEWCWERRLWVEDLNKKSMMALIEDMLRIWRSGWYMVIKRGEETELFQTGWTEEQGKFAIWEGGAIGSYVGQWVCYRCACRGWLWRRCELFSRMRVATGEIVGGW